MTLNILLVCIGIRIECQLTLGVSLRLYNRPADIGERIATESPAVADASAVRRYPVLGAWTVAPDPYSCRLVAASPSHDLPTCMRPPRSYRLTNSSALRQLKIKFQALRFLASVSTWHQNSYALIFSTNYRTSSIGTSLNRRELALNSLATRTSSTDRTTSPWRNPPCETCQIAPG